MVGGPKLSARQKSLRQLRETPLRLPPRPSVANRPKRKAPTTGEDGTPKRARSTAPAPDTPPGVESGASAHTPDVRLNSLAVSTFNSADPSVAPEAPSVENTQLPGNSPSSADGDGRDDVSHRPVDADTVIGNGIDSNTAVSVSLTASSLNEDGNDNSSGGGGRNNAESDEAGSPVNNVRSRTEVPSYKDTVNRKKKGVKRVPKKRMPKEERNRYLASVGSDPKRGYEELASRWMTDEEIRIMVDAGCKVTQEERAIIHRHLDAFKLEQQKLAWARLAKDPCAPTFTDANIVEILFAKGKGGNTARAPYKDFWVKLARKLPGRPVRSVKDITKRMHDQTGWKGTWTPDEDAALRAAWIEHEDDWVKISKIVERAPLNCRDRWRDFTSGPSAARRKGPWSENETEKLTRVVRKLQRQYGLEVGGPTASWDEVCDGMRGRGASRTAAQCRKKWMDRIAKIERDSGLALTNASLIARLRELEQEFRHPADIVWARVASDDWDGPNAHRCRNHWSRLKAILPNRLEKDDDITLGDFLCQIETALKEKENEPEAANDEGINGEGNGHEPLLGQEGISTDSEDTGDAAGVSVTQHQTEESIVVSVLEPQPADRLQLLPGLQSDVEGRSSVESLSSCAGPREQSEGEETVTDISGIAVPTQPSIRRQSEEAAALAVAMEPASVGDVSTENELSLGEENAPLTGTTVLVTAASPARPPRPERVYAAGARKSMRLSLTAGDQ